MLVVPLKPGPPDRRPRDVVRAVVAQNLVDLAADVPDQAGGLGLKQPLRFRPDHQAGHVAEPERSCA